MFARGVDVDPDWRRSLRSRVARLRREVGLPVGRFRMPRSAPAQLTLPGLARPAPRVAVDSGA